jgi:hypothetical protein
VQDQLRPTLESVQKTEVSLSDLQARLNTLEPLIRTLIERKLNSAIDLPPKKFANALPILAKVTEVAKDRRTAPDAYTAGRFRAKLRAVELRTPMFWTVAGNALSLQTTTASPNLGNCIERPYTSMHSPQAHTQSGPYLLGFHDCTLILDDVAGLEKSDAWKDYKWSISEHGAVGLIMSLANVRVEYRGGNLPPARIIQFEHCFFDFRLTAQPESATGSELAEGLIASTELDRVAVRLPSSGI